MRWKWGKLVVNLANSVEALCGPPALRGEVSRLARDEARECFAVAGIDAATDDEDAGRRGDLLQRQLIGGERRPGSSTWQSLARGLREVEADWFNGEIVLLGRQHGVPTPVNELLQRLSNEAAAAGLPPGSYHEDDLLSMLGAA
jgi:2-dehydropantoate 2-reductase